ncbi:carbohydrate-binding module family 52 protein [Aplosporella prunicola CBS 121167]|uniref:Carbohydrate-binding module family 52 protein n=1 Tax=Aplosporella prunicola CBS 121167 TaxID=1176127 RepID=A0A6A6B1G6_9PEZI|nr:carbohydrate-binding module family 52 protein [Aplosporella prunicola CBS 121167]KAF2138019.1 carbohydrate-binding module family 52 protein [Aplosporella prunicola CBS 121167]
MVMFSLFLLVLVWLGVISTASPVLGRPGLLYLNGTNVVRDSTPSPGLGAEVVSPEVGNATTVTTPVSSDATTLTAVSSRQDVSPAAMEHHSPIDPSSTVQKTNSSRAVVCYIHDVPTPCSTLSGLTSAETTPLRTKLTHALTLPATTASEVPSSAAVSPPAGDTSATASPPSFTLSQNASTSAVISPAFIAQERPAAWPAHNNTVYAMCRVHGTAVPCSAVERVQTVSASDSSRAYAGWSSSRTSLAAFFSSTPSFPSIIPPFRNASAPTAIQNNTVSEPTASATRTISIHGAFFEHDATKRSASTLLTVAHAKEIRTTTATSSASPSFEPESTNVFECGGQAFSPYQYTCWDDTTLCPVTDGKRLEACNGGCFDPEAYACTDGVLEGIHDGKLPNGAAATATPIPASVWPSSAATIAPSSTSDSSSSTTAKSSSTASGTSAATTTAAVAPTAVPPDDSKEDDDDLSSGQIAAIATSTTSAALLLFLISILLFRRRNARLRKATDEVVYPEIAYLYDPPVPTKFGGAVVNGRGARSSGSSAHGDTPLLPPLPQMPSLLPLQGVSGGEGVDRSPGAGAGVVSMGTMRNAQTQTQPQRRQLDILNEEDEDEAAAAENQPQSQPQTRPPPAAATAAPKSPAPPSVTLTTSSTPDSPAVTAARPLLSFSAHALKRKTGSLALTTTLPPFPPEGVLYHTPTHSGSSSNSGNGNGSGGLSDGKGKGKGKRGGGSGGSEEHWDTIDLQDHGQILTPVHSPQCPCPYCITHNPARPSTSSSCASGSSCASSCASNDGWGGPRSHRPSIISSRGSKTPWWCPGTHIPTSSEQLEEAERSRGRLTVRNGAATPASGRSRSGGGKSGRSARSSELEFADRRLLGREF